MRFKWNKNRFLLGITTSHDSTGLRPIKDNHYVDVFIGFIQITFVNSKNHVRIGENK